MHYPSKTNKKTCVFILCFLVLTLQQLNAQSCNLTQYITSERGETDTTFYIYDDKTNLLVEEKYTVFENQYTNHYYYYENELSYVFDGMFNHSYFYNDNNQISGVVHSDDLGVSNFFSLYDYDSKNRLIKITNFETAFMEDTVIESYTTNTYAGDKMIKTEEFTNYPDNNSTPHITTTYEYDSHKNPKYNPIWFPEFTLKYMVTKTIYKDDSGVNYDDECYTRTCIYNKKGYPEKCTSNYLDGTEKMTEEYKFNCK